MEKKSMSFAMIFILHLFNCSHFALPPEDFLVNLSLQPLGNWIFPSKAITVSSKYLKCQIYQFLVNVYLSKVVVLQNWSCESIQIHNKKQLIRYSFFAKSFFLDICLGSECGPDIFKIAFLFSVVLLVYFLISNKIYLKREIAITKQPNFRNLPVQSFWCNGELRLPRFKTPPVLIHRWIRTPFKDHRLFVEY